MPEALIPVFAALIGAGTSIGTTVYNSMNQPSGPKPPGPADLALQSKQAVDTETSNRALATRQASQFLPGITSDTSGSLSPEALQQFSSNFSGNSNLSQSPEMKAMVAKYLGLDSGGTDTFGGGTGFGGANPASPGLTG